MKKSFGISGILILILTIIMVNSCKKEAVPALTTSAVTDISITTATCGGTIINEGSGTIIERGVCWGTGNSPTIYDSRTLNGPGAGSFISAMNGLSSATNYFVRAYAINVSGTGYGNSMSFATQDFGTVTDINGNVYKTITVVTKTWLEENLTQTWMAENLKTTRFNDDSDIPLITDETTWDTITTPGYCLYNNDLSNKSIYGALYNWYAVNTGKLCPTGWHVSTYAEWNTLIAYLGGIDIAGDKLKETGIAHWIGPNSGTTNENGFTALPGGSRFHEFWSLGVFGGWWSYVGESNIYCPARYTVYDEPVCGLLNYVPNFGLSVRCVKDY